MDKIHYLPTEGTTGLWGLRGVRMKPRECPGRGFCSCDDPPVKRCEVLAWQDEMESCKSNKLEIVNPEVTGVTEDSMNQCLHIKGKYLKPGDIFDLPIGYEFKKQFSHCYTLGENHYVLRLVKTEMKETVKIVTREDLKESLIALRKLADDHHFINQAESIKDVINTVQQAIDGNYEIHYPVDGGDPKWIKKEEKKLTFCDKCGEMKYKDTEHTCIVPQPEPEESQEELLKELLKTHKFTENTNVLKHFTIQRKKQ